MTAQLWLLNGAAITAGMYAAWKLGRISARHELMHDIIRNDAAIHRLAQTVVAQQRHIDYLEGGGDVVAEAENLLREPGS